MCLINYLSGHVGVWGNGGINSPLLTSVLDGGEWSASRPDRFTPGKRVPDTHWMGGHHGPSRRCGEEKNLLPLPRTEPQFLDRLARSLLLYRFNYPGSTDRVVK
jgi:hypothetical protein